MCKEINKIEAVKEKLRVVLDLTGFFHTFTAKEILANHEKFQEWQRIFFESNMADTAEHRKEWLRMGDLFNCLAGIATKYSANQIIEALDLASHLNALEIPVYNEEVQANSIYALTFVYPDGKKIVVKDRSFFDSVKDAYERVLNPDATPIKVVFPTGQQIYFDDNEFYNYLKGDISQDELIGNTHCKGLYRNNGDLPGKEDAIIDKGSLWKRTGSFLILIDGDYYFNIEKDSEDLEGFTEI